MKLSRTIGEGRGGGRIGIVHLCACTRLGRCVGFPRVERDLLSEEQIRKGVRAGLDQDDRCLGSKNVRPLDVQRLLKRPTRVERRCNAGTVAVGEDFREARCGQGPLRVENRHVVLRPAGYRRRPRWQ